MLRKLTELSPEDGARLMAVYLESNSENAAWFAPDAPTPEEGLRRTEAGFLAPGGLPAQEGKHPRGLGGGRHFPLRPAADGVGWLPLAGGPGDPAGPPGAGLRRTAAAGSRGGACPGGRGLRPELRQQEEPPFPGTPPKGGLHCGAGPRLGLRHRGGGRRKLRDAAAHPVIRKNARPLWAGRSLYSAFTRNCRAVCRLSRSELPKEALLRKGRGSPR